MSDAASTSTTDTASTSTTTTDVDAIARAAFPSMFKEGPAPAPVQPSTTPTTDGDATARAAFPSMAPAELAPEAPAPAPSAATPGASTTPVSLPASAIEITVPASLHLDPADLQAFDDTARVLGLDAEGAQKIIDLHAQATANYTAEIDAAWAATRAEWRATVEKDPELGGAKFTQTVATAREVIGKYGTPALKQMFNDLGIGNHPELVRLMARVGRALASAGTTAAASIPQTDDAVLRAAFPSMYGNK